MRNKDRVETVVGTSVIETPNRLHNPVTERSEYMENLSEDGYCRRFLAMLYSQTGGCNHINLNSSPVATFDKEKWRLEETDGHFALVKREPDSALDKLTLGTDE